HIRAGDLRLLSLAGAVPALLPWHLPVWWQLSRLRAAVEGDCDLRVLRRHPGRTRSYIELLLEVASRRALPGALAAMLSEPYETLKRRIRVMTMSEPKRPWVRGGVLAGISVALTVLACAAPGPTDANDQGGDPWAASGSAPDAGSVPEGVRPAVFTPYSVRPEIRNRDGVAAVLEPVYHALREEPGFGGTAEVWLYVDEEGRPRDIRLNRSTGYPALDDAAMRVAEVVELTPALNRDQERAVWVSLPVRFGAADGRESEGTELSVAGGVRDPVAADPHRVVPPGDARTSSVTGTIRYTANDQPAAYAQVFVRGTGRGTLSNGEGRFRIDHVPVGDQEVVVHLVGYREISRTVSVTPGEASAGHFRLQERVIPLDPLTVR
ncbi:MAG: TonB family protein, partial [Longimicrobiales bacterium]|nr:TonB family protein [Longimicrobiales bacterium]